MLVIDVYNQIPTLESTKEQGFALEGALADSLYGREEMRNARRPTCCDRTDFQRDGSVEAITLSLGGFPQTDKGVIKPIYTGTLSPPPVMLALKKLFQNHWCRLSDIFKVAGNPA